MLQELSGRKERLESELSRLSEEFRGQQALTRQTPAQIQAALPAGAALIDLLEFVDYFPAAEKRGVARSEPHLIAFIVRSDRPIVACDLGPVQPIADAVDRWRAESAAEAPATGSNQTDVGRTANPSHPGGIGNPPHGEERIANPSYWGQALRRLIWHPLERY